MVGEAWRGPAGFPALSELIVFHPTFSMILFVVSSIAVPKSYLESWKTPFDEEYEAHSTNGHSLGTDTCPSSTIPDIRRAIFSHLEPGISLSCDAAAEYQSISKVSRRQTWLWLL